MPPDPARDRPASRPILGIVGPCAAGKSTLASGLRASGIEARHIAQEHSYVLDMWQRLTNPLFLVFLKVSYPNTLVRRSLNWTMADFEEQLRRLGHAQAHADLVVDTDELTSEEVLQVVLTFLRDQDIVLPLP